MTELQEVEPANLLAIYDLSLDGQYDAKCIREAKDCKDLAGALQDLSDQGKCCRLYIAGYLSSKSRDTFENHLRKIVPLYKNSARKGFNSLTTQWAKTRPPLFHTLDIILANVQVRIIPFGKQPFNDRLVGATCSICCYEAVNNALVIIIQILTDTGTATVKLGHNKSLGLFNGSERQRRHREVFGRYIDVFLQENQEHRSCQQTDHSPELRFKVYILHFYRTALRLYEEFSEQVERNSETEVYGRSYSVSQTLLLEKLARNAFHNDVFLETANSISVVAKSLVKFVRETSAESLSPDIKCLLAEVDSLSDIIASPFDRLANRFAREMDVMNTFRNIQDSRDSRLLNLLAFIFLPASLATSLLSMNTRFHDLGLLLYDFCGVIVLFASILALIFLSLKAYQWTKRLLATRLSLRNWNTYSSPWTYVGWWTILLSSFLAMAWPMVLSSFLVGMVVDVSLGSRILGYGAAVVVGVMLILVFVTRNEWKGILESEQPDLDEVLAPIRDEDYSIPEVI